MSLFERVDDALNRATERSVAVIAVPLVFVIGWLDYVTGPEVGLSLLYLLVISVAAWRGKYRTGLFAAVMAAICWTLADVTWRETSYLPITLWNGSTRLAIYCTTAYLISRVQRDRADLRQVNDVLQQALERQSTLARIDPVTALENRRAFYERVRSEAATARRLNEPLRLYFVDLDDFKSVNDRYGHTTGDAVLKRVGEIILQVVSSTDHVARIGGDEFAIVSRNNGKDASVVVNELASAVAALRDTYDRTRLGATIGFAEFREIPENIEIMIRAADEAMYSRKQMRAGTDGER